MGARCPERPRCLSRRPAHAPPRYARALGSPRRSPCPHNQVRPTYLTPRAGRRAGGRKEGRAAAGTAWRGRRLRAPPGAASADHAKGTGVPARRAPKESPPTLTRKRHSSPRPSATRGDGCGGSRRPLRCGAGERAARGCRQLTGGTAPQQPPPPPKKPEPERAGPEVPLTRATAAAGARLPPAPLHLQRSLRLLERGEEERGSPPSLGLFW